MNIKKASGRAQGTGDDVNITPVMNLFLVLIPFLLLTAEFVRIAVSELNLPSTAQSKTVDQQETNKPLVIILLAIDDKGLTLKAPKMRFQPIPLRNGRYQVDRLANDLGKIKERYSRTEEMTIQPADHIPYEVIVEVMDACRDTGFPNISISG